MGFTDIFENPLGWLERLINGGGLTLSALLLLLMSLGITKADFSWLFKDQRKKGWSWDWTGKTSYADNVEKNKYIFAALDKIADSIEDMGKAGELGSDLIKTAGDLQDLMDAYAATGSFAGQRPTSRRPPWIRSPALSARPTPPRRPGTS